MVPFVKIWAFCVVTTVSVIGFFYSADGWANARYDWATATKNAHIHTRTIAIGSSLTGAAFPPDFEVNIGGLPQDAVRWRFYGVRSDELITLTQRAIANGAKLIFLETAPFVRGVGVGDFASVPLFSRRVRSGIKASLGVYKYDINTLHADKTRAERSEIYRFTPGVEPHVAYHPTDWRSNPRLDDMFSSAKALDVQIILLSFPRAVSPVNEIYAHDALHDLTRAETALAQHYGLKHFSPQSVWPDQYFRDRSHLNQSGRLRYAQEFSDWLATQ